MRYAKNPDETCDVTITIRIKSEMKAKLIERAENNQRTLSDYLKMSLEKWLEWEPHILETEREIEDYL